MQIKLVQGWAHTRNLIIKTNKGKIYQPRTVYIIMVRVCYYTKCDTITLTQTILHANGYGRRLTLIRQANIGALNNTVRAD